MVAYFDYLREMFLKVLEDIGTFLYKAFISPWTDLGNIPLQGDVTHLLDDVVGESVLLFESADLLDLRSRGCLDPCVPDDER